ncbi:tyrosine-protein phosphatase [Tsuneonella amylolytica]|uniref:tyrosine-protein phosphatase n=1 Tax=Tsuneonella amylolytica TaxID=2338327 RepID=UPI000EA92659|nr:tyrosine-protein phosphatase [Tsuneonella amylolytica]
MTDRFQPPLEGIHNFRDYGGYAADGGTVRRGLLYRSGQHVKATDEDLEALRALDIRTVIDLRGITEREMNPCRRHEGWAGEVIAHDGETSSSPPHMDIDASTTTAQYARDRMLSVYTRMPANPAMHAMFGRYLNALADREGASLVHCFAGKDRTGIAATLLLHILGVSEEDQRDEFLLTNQAPTLAVLRAQSVPGIEARLGRKVDDESIRALLEVHEDYLARFHKTVREMAGSLDAWLADTIGVDEGLRDRLRAKFVA